MTKATLILLVCRANVVLGGQEEEKPGVDVAKPKGAFLEPETHRDSLIAEMVELADSLAAEPPG